MVDGYSDIDGGRNGGSNVSSFTRIILQTGRAAVKAVAKVVAPEPDNLSEEEMAKKIAKEILREAREGELIPLLGGVQSKTNGAPQQLTQHAGPSGSSSASGSSAPSSEAARFVSDMNKGASLKF